MFRNEQSNSDHDHRKKRKPTCTSKSAKKPSTLRQRPISRNDDIQGTIFSATPMTNVIQEVST